MSFGQLGRMLGITSDPKFDNYINNLKNVTRDDLEQAFQGKLLWLCKTQALIFLLFPLLCLVNLPIKRECSIFLFIDLPAHSNSGIFVEKALPFTIGMVVLAFFFGLWKFLRELTPETIRKLAHSASRGKKYRYISDSATLALIIDSTQAGQICAMTTAGAGLGSIAIFMTRPLIDQYPLMNLLTFIPSVVGTVIILKNYFHTEDYLDRIEKNIIEPMKTENPGIAYSQNQ